MASLAQTRKTDAPPEPAHHFETLSQEHSASRLGLWVFLLTELMLFGALFASYTVYRFTYAAAFREAGEHMILALGGPNTGVLIVGSMTIALAHRSASLGQRRRLWVLLAVTAVLGVIFLAGKGWEYVLHYQDHLVPGLTWDYPGQHPEQAKIFFLLYFAMTGLHALHLSIGTVIVAIQAWLAARGRFLRERSTPVELMGLYWHFVDIVWIFLLPLLYFPGRSL